jgi:hypothetical protein
MELYEEFLKLWEGRADFARHPTGAPLECVIVEPREHPCLAGVLANVSCVLPNAAVTVVHSRENAGFVRDILGDGTTVRCLELFEGNIDRSAYCELLTDQQFWRDMRGEQVLVFQTDTGLRKNRILRFMEYDYIGAPWSWTVAGDPRICIGNGGLSLRNRALMCDISARFRRDPTYSDPTCGEPEDIFFARHLIDFDDVQLPSREEAAAFAVEHCVYDADPFGFHQAYKFWSEEIVKKWFDSNELDLPIGNGLIKIKDAFVETACGRVFDDIRLREWLSLGISAKGLRIPRGTRLACIDRDPAPGQRKTLRMTLERSDGTMYDCRILLDRGRVPDEFFFAST